MSKEIVQKNTSAVTTVTPTDLDEWGGPRKLNANDIIIPKILPMQGLSDLVADGKAVMGEFRDSLSGAKIGSIAEPFEIIPFHMDLFWDIMEDDGTGNFKWLKTEPLIEDPLNPGYNDNLPWQDTVNGVAIKRIRRMNFYCLLPKEIGVGATPYVISFKSTSFRAGRQMYTQMYMRNARQGLAPCAYLFKVGGEKEKNDKGTFIVPNVELSRPVNPDEYKEALSWFKQIKKGGTKVDESDVHTEAADVADTGPMTSTGAF